jgi:hypothetical protein
LVELARALERNPPRAISDVGVNPPRQDLARSVRDHLESDHRAARTVELAAVASPTCKPAQLERATRGAAEYAGTD